VALFKRGKMRRPAAKRSPALQDHEDAPEPLDVLLARATEGVEIDDTYAPDAVPDRPASKGAPGKRARLVEPASGASPTTARREIMPGPQPKIGDCQEPGCGRTDVKLCKSKYRDFLVCEKCYKSLWNHDGKWSATDPPRRPGPKAATAPPAPARKPEATKATPAPVPYTVGPAPASVARQALVFRLSTDVTVTIALRAGMTLEELGSQLVKIPAPGEAVLEVGG
jgi:hypothetical protein